jgi:hypothetical protein
MEGDMGSTELTQFDGAGALTQWREPEEVLAQAQKAAVALKKVIDLKENKVVFNNETYLEREDWGTVGAFFNCTAKSIETRFVDYGESGRGFEAVAVVVDRNTGFEIGRAESMTLDSEENWGDVPKYVWKDKLDEDGKKIWNPKLRNGKGGYEATKVLDGSTKKPLFQLRSMAQTRAEAKALKGVFSWVVVLAGYRPTPAEELTGHEDFERGQGHQSKPQVSQPQRASEKAAKEADTKTQAASTTTGSTIGGNAAATNPGEKEISGIIESAKQAKSGTLWVTVKGEPLVVAVDEKNIDVDMVAGNFIKFRGLLKKNDRLASQDNPQGKFLSLIGLIELSKVQEGEVTKADDGKLSSDASAVADELFGKQEPQGQAAIEDLKKNGTVTTASQLPEGYTKKPGSIGWKKARRLDALCSQNKKTNNGFTHEDMKKILAELPVPALHVHDMEEGMYSVFEAWALGEKDFREFWKE